VCGTLLLVQERLVDDRFLCCFLGVVFELHMISFFKVLSLNLFGVTEENDRSGNGTVSLRSEYRKVFPATCPESLEESRDIALRFL
jgi:hypothetical protein